MEMAKARMIENNAFIVLNYSFLTARMRLPGSRREFEVEKISAARGDPEIFRGWARQDSNLGPRDYESPALTAELQALFHRQTSRAKKSLASLSRCYSTVNLMKLRKSTKTWQKNPKAKSSPP
jgi:hypothetical protein